MPELSVVIPCYNQAHLLPRAVESCLNQTLRDTEIIVVDDGSPDDVYGALKPYGSRVRYFRQENKGLSGARNTGLGLSSGRFLKFLDSDDWLYQDALRLQLASIRHLPDHISIIGVRYSNEGAKELDFDAYPAFRDLMQAMCFRNILPPVAFLFPRNAVEEVGGYDTTELVRGGHEDYELLWRLGLKGYRSVCLQTIGAGYRVAPGTMSKNTAKMLKTRLGVMKTHAEALLDRGATVDQLIMLFGAMLVFSQAPGVERVKELFSRILAELEKRPGEMNASRLACFEDFVTIFQRDVAGMGAEESGAALPFLHRAREIALEAKQKLHLYRFPVWIHNDPEEDFRVRAYRSSSLAYHLCRLMLRMAEEGCAEAAVWGAGTGGRILVKFAEGYGIKPLAIVDSNAELWGKELNGISVISPEEAFQRGFTDYVIAAPEWNHEIRELILAETAKLGQKPPRIFITAPF